LSSPIRHPAFVICHPAFVICHPPYGKQVDAMTLCGKAHSDCVRDQAEREKCAGDCA